jgi:glycerophosphoryl diester phosphodiesterase
VAAISAHQGGSETADRGTYEAYQHALTSGAEYAEFDIRKTADGVLVACHDARAGHAGPLLADLGYDDLCERAGYLVPKAGELMELLAGRLTGHLDLKETGYEQEVVSLALGTFGPGRFVVTSLEDSSIQAISQAFPSVRIALSLGRDLKEVPRRRWPAVRRSELLPLRRLRRCGAGWAAVNYRLGQFGVIRACQRNGIGIMVWTVDSDKLIDRFLADPRIDVLVTNRPRHAASRRAALARRPPAA